MNQVILILGGARSGKSRYAQELAAASPGKVLFLATAISSDGDMARRIEVHRSTRPTAWRTLESPRHLVTPLADALQEEQVVLIDCLTVWVSNVLMAHPDFPFEGGVNMAPLQDSLFRESEKLLALARARDLTLIIVSNEVGMGVVPAYPSGHAFREVLGRVNQLWAARADQVFLMVAGLPMRLKGLGPRVQGEGPLNPEPRRQG